MSGILPGSQTSATDKRRAVSGSYYDQASVAVDGLGTFSNTAATLTATRITATEHLLLPGTYANLGFTLGTAAAGKLVRLMLYEFDPLTGLPGALLRDSSGTLVADATIGFGYEIAMTSDLILTAPTRIVAAIWSDGAPAVGGWPAVSRGTWGRTLASGGRRGVCYRDLAFGAAPNPFGTVDGYLTTTIPAIVVKAR